MQIKQFTASKVRRTTKSGQPIPRATVQVKDLTTAVTTDEDGNYEINAPSNGGMGHSKGNPIQ